MASRYLSITKYNARLLLNLNTAAAVLLMALTPFIFSFAFLGYQEVAKLSELYFSITGILLFATLSSIENQEQAKELVHVRSLPQWVIQGIRILLMLLLGAAMTLMILVYAKLKGANFPLWELASGAAITVLYLGSITYTAVNLTNQVSTGYIISFAYYLMEYSTKGKYTGELYLFSLLKMDMTPKYYLLTVSVLLLGLNLIYGHFFKSKLNTSGDA